MRHFFLSGLAVCFLMLSACAGFEPVYGVNRNTPVGVETKLANIEIGNIPDRGGQYLRNELIDRFYREGRPAAPLYLLMVGNLEEKITELDVTRTSDATRAQLRIRVHMVLRDRHTGGELLERDLQAVNSYNILGSEFATRVTEDNARRNVLDDLARQIEMQLNLYFRRSS